MIDQKKIVELPLNGRDYNQLALLSPGVLPGTPRLASVNFKGVLNVNGNRTFNNVFLLDGVDNISYSNSFRGENVQLVQPSIEALQEFKIQTNAYSAEYGRSSGAVVNATIKSGTNSVRGSVYEFLRNDALDANNFFSNALGAPKPKRRAQPVRRRGRRPAREEPDVLVRRLRGPARPGRRPARPAGADRSREGRACSARRSSIRSRRAGRRSAQNAQGQWVIPRERWDPVGAAIVALIPDPNVRGHAPIYASTPVTDTRQDQFDVRIDHQFTPTLTLFGRYSFVDTDYVPPGAAAGPGRRARSTTRSARTEPIAGAGARRDLDRSRRRSSATSASGSRAANYYTYPPNFGVDGAARDRPEERAERSRDRRRRAEGQHPGLRRRRPAHVDAAVPDAAVVESARDVQPEPRRALRQVRRRVPARARRGSTISTRRSAG